MTAPAQPRKKSICDEARLSLLVRAWQRAPAGLKEQWWQLFVNETADWLMAIICDFKRDLRSLGSHQEIRAQLILHLHNRVLPAYRHGRGRLFSLVTVACQNYIRTLLEKQQRIEWRQVVATDCNEDQEIVIPIDAEVYGLAAEIRERLEHFTAPGRDFRFFLIRNLVVYVYAERGGRGTSPTLEQIAKIVSKIVSIPKADALLETTAAVLLLQAELAEFRGRPSLYEHGPRPEVPRGTFQINCAPSRGAAATKKPKQPLQLTAN